MAILWLLLFMLELTPLYPDAAPLKPTFNVFATTVKRCSQVKINIIDPVGIFQAPFDQESNF